MNFKAIILAAGKGTRMKSKYPKVVHKVCGKEMVNHIIDVSKKSGVKDIVAILGHESEVVKNILPEDTMIAMQTEQLGTGHAVKMAKEYINDEDTIVILCGDTPLIKEDTLKRLFDYHIENKYTATVLTTVVENPTGYGRVIRDENGDVLKIVEQKDGTPNSFNALAALVIVPAVSIISSNMITFLPFTSPIRFITSQTLALGLLLSIIASGTSPSN